MRRLRAVAAFLAGVLAAGPAFAASSPFGIATPDGSGAVAWAGPFTGFLLWINAEQANFYRELTAALKHLSESNHAALFLIGISFAYGVFHAVGPGHGKAVISSYLLASGDSLRRGIGISFAAGFAQALTAIIVVTVGTLVFRVTAVTMTRATDAMEIASYAMIAICGVWLLWTRLRPAEARSTASAAPLHVHDASCMHNLSFSAAGSTAATATPSTFSCDCGHAHAPDPTTLEGPMTLKSAAAAVLAVGLRPCSGAIIVLVFALSQQLYWAGILSVLMMAAGTGLTVAALAIFAVKARDTAARLAGSGAVRRFRILRVLEIAAAATILLFGLVMLGGALVAA